MTEGGISVKDLAERIDQLEGKVAALTALLVVKSELTEEDLRRANVLLSADGRFLEQSVTGIQNRVIKSAVQHLDLFRTQLRD
jgi:hypothetical protein